MPILCKMIWVAALLPTTPVAVRVDEEEALDITGANTTINMTTAEPKSEAGNSSTTVPPTTAETTAATTTSPKTTTTTVSTTTDKTFEADAVMVSAVETANHAKSHAKDLAKTAADDNINAKKEASDAVDLTAEAEKAAKAFVQQRAKAAAQVSDALMARDVAVTAAKKAAKGYQNAQQQAGTAVKASETLQGLAKKIMGLQKAEEAKQKDAKEHAMNEEVKAVAWANKKGKELKEADRKKTQAEADAERETLEAANATAKAVILKADAAKAVTDAERRNKTAEVAGLKAKLAQHVADESKAKAKCAPEIATANELQQKATEMANFAKAAADAAGTAKGGAERVLGNAVKAKKNAECHGKEAKIEDVKAANACKEARKAAEVKQRADDQVDSWRANKEWHMKAEAAARAKFTVAVKKEKLGDRAAQAMEASSTEDKEAMEATAAQSAAASASAEAQKKQKKAAEETKDECEARNKYVQLMNEAAAASRIVAGPTAAPEMHKHFEPKLKDPVRGGDFVSTR